MADCLPQSPILKETFEEYGDFGKFVRVRNPVKVEKVLQDLINDGPTKLQVITDFDFTLTRNHINGKRCTSAHGVIDGSPLMPDEYREKAKTIYDTYHPFEIDLNLTAEQKTPYIIKWFKSTQELLIKHKISKDKIREMVKTGNSVLRDQAKDVLSQLNENNIPCLVFSAGQGDLVEAILNRDNVYFPNIKVVSNFMEFNEEGVCVAFKDPLIHIYNKNETALDNPKYFEKLSHRNNAMVLGDSLGDVNMDTGLHNPGAVLKIGFLNDRIEQRLDSFMDNYDVVLIDDQSFKYVDILLRKIIGSSGRK